ncbi:MAG: hypothetical protein IIA40_00540 [SAR324 cluster bacterium]|nr:hypothetical protein [SAR324 cluster bacterium]
MWHFIRVIALGGCLLAIVGNSAYAEALSEEESRALLNGTTWKMGLFGNFTISNVVTYWDWKPDGSVCGRIAGANKDEPCADVGQWRLEGNRLCWRYDWLPFTYYRVACVRIEGTGERKYLAISEKTGNLLFAFFVVE